VTALPVKVVNDSMVLMQLKVLQLKRDSFRSPKSAASSKARMALSRVDSACCPADYAQEREHRGGTPIENFDSVRAGVAGDRSQFWKDFSLPFYGFNKPDAKVSEGLLDAFRLQGMTMSIKGAYDCIKAFSENRLYRGSEPARCTHPIMHCDADQIVPFADSAELTAKIVNGAKLKVYQGAPHGLCQTMPDTINADLLAFIRS
jgi:hypothetical protein